MQERFAHFTSLIHSLRRCIRKIESEEMARFGIKSSQVEIIYYLYQRDMTAKELSVASKEDKANLSRSIEQLEILGLIETTSGKTRRYNSLIRLSAKGREVGLHMSERIKEILFAAEAGVAGDDVEKMYASLGIIDKNLRKLCEAYV